MTINSLIITIVILILIDTFLAAVRSSLVNAHLPRLLNMPEERQPAVERTIRRIEQPRARFSLRLAHVFLLIWIAICAAWIGLLAGWINADLKYAGLEIAGIAAVSTLVLFSLESLMEGWVLRNPEEWAIRTSGIAGLVDALLGPLAGLGIRMMGQNEASLQQITAPTDDELKSWVEQGQEDGALEKEERQMIYSIFQYGDTLAREIMVPRIDMLALDVETPITTALNAVIESGHSRVPVYENTIDNIIGLLYAKDLLKFQPCDDALTALRTMLRPVYFVPEAKKLDDLLTEMQTQRVHIAVVVDEYGGVAGLVTLEDIMEEIIGEIRDEYDQGEEAPYVKISDDEYIFQGNVDLDDFNELMNTELTKDTADTIGGFVYGEIGKVPTGGETIRLEGVDLTIEQVIGRRIRKVRARMTIPRELGNEAQHADK